MPHERILIWIQPTDQPRDGDAYDKLVCAEIPNPLTQPLLYEMVKNHHMHGPCGLLNPTCVCMRDGICSKGFPKQFCEVTADGDGTYPTYRRHNNGVSVRKIVRGTTVNLDNRFVIPYNPYLLCKYNCHINVEICSSVSSVKYINKYIFKGHDRAQVGLGDTPEDVDETSDYLEGRCI